MHDGSIWVWKCDSWVLILKEEPINNSISDPKFSPDLSLILLDKRNWITLCRESSHKISIESMKAKVIGFSPDSTLVLTRRISPCYDAEFLELLSAETGQEVHKLGKLGGG